jgi:hypothetical protein
MHVPHDELQPTDQAASSVVSTRDDHDDFRAIETVTSGYLSSRSPYPGPGEKCKVTAYGRHSNPICHKFEAVNVARDV